MEGARKVSPELSPIYVIVFTGIILFQTSLGPIISIIIFRNIKGTYPWQTYPKLFLTDILLWILLHITVVSLLLANLGSFGGAAIITALCYITARIFFVDPAQLTSKSILLHLLLMTIITAIIGWVIK